MGKKKKGKSDGTVSATCGNSDETGKWKIKSSTLVINHCSRDSNNKQCKRSPGTGKLRHLKRQIITAGVALTAKSTINSQKLIKHV